ncbi:hypothetical protein OIU77_007753 [Salix suchowensis]|uniref:RING-type E3 ubiquitin transferase n=1 Tax=Salix suchowensis TaxID=1278906 RepID=A0ABQ9AH75_9ROSI|nr:hypothetical protein OIU77_007753 [Salix suchowensis]
MFDPVVVSSGQTFERLSVQVCHDLGFTPTLHGNSPPDLTTVIPNLAIKSTIQNWCDSSGTKRPPAPDYSSLEEIIREKMKFSSPPASSLSKSMHSSEESVIVNASAAPSASPLTPLPLSTRPACYSSTSSSSNSMAESETLNLNENPNSTREENEIMEKLASLDVHDQEQGVISLRKITRTKEETRVSLCTPRLLSALRTLFVSRYFSVQTNAIASLVNLSLEKANKVKIVRSGFVPLLIDVLKGGCDEAQEHAAGALFSLALEDDNKMAIGVLGALQPLMHMLRAESERARHDSSLALYHLSLIQSNRVKLVKLGAVSMLLSMVKSG